MTPLYSPLCARCEEDGIERQATEERFGEPLCLAHAHAYDDREPPEPDLNRPTIQEQFAHFSETYRKARFT